MPGTFGPQGGASSCVNCGNGTVTTTFGSIACVVCLRARACVLECAELIGAVVLAWLLCPVAWQSRVFVVFSWPVSAAVCAVILLELPARPGTRPSSCQRELMCYERVQITSQNGRAQCSSCLPGSYANTTGLSACLSCDPGRAQQQSAASTCGLCYPGSFASNRGQALCTACSAAQFGVDVGATSCQPCPIGTFMPFTNRTACQVCS